MRILWLDASASPWKQADGWEYLERYQLEFIRTANATDARARLDSPLPLAAAVINADVPGALELVADIKRGRTPQKIPIILVSETWAKKDFKAHSTSPHAVENYARLPIPADGFVNVVASITGMSAEELSGQSPAIEVEDPSGLLVPGAELDSPTATTPLPMAPESTSANARKRGAIQALKEAMAPWKKSDQPIEPTGTVEPTRPLPTVAPLGKYSQADAEVLRKYLALREQELQRSLADKQNIERLYEKISKETEALRKQFRELERMKADSDEKAERFEKRHSEQEKAVSEQKEQAEFAQESLRERVKFLEEQLNESKARYISLKDRVRKDVRKIQTREKELETRLELVKKDSETLIAERDRQVLELKRKIDALEFDLDLVQDRKVQAESDANKYVDKLSRVARTLQVAFGMLEEVEEEQTDNQKTKPIVGGAAAQTDQSGIEALLKPPTEVLDAQALAEAEAPTRIFQKDSDADKILAGVIEGNDGEQTATAQQDDDLDQALGS